VGALVLVRNREPFLFVNVGGHTNIVKTLLLVGHRAPFVQDCLWRCRHVHARLGSHGNSNLAAFVLLGGIQLWSEQSYIVNFGL
jgi:hypothetical protein